MSQRIMIRDVQRATCQQLDVPPIVMTCSGRRRDWVRARQIAMRVAHDLTGASLPAIGRRFGNRDHTTVLAALRRIDQCAAADPTLRATIEAVRNRVLAGQIAPAIPPADQEPTCTQTPARGATFGFSRDWWCEQDRRFTAALRAAHPETYRPLLKPTEARP